MIAPTHTSPTHHPLNRTGFSIALTHFFYTPSYMTCLWSFGLIPFCWKANDGHCHRYKLVFWHSCSGTHPYYGLIITRNITHPETSVSIVYPLQMSLLDFRKFPKLLKLSRFPSSRPPARLLPASLRCLWIVDNRLCLRFAALRL